MADADDRLSQVHTCVGHCAFFLFISGVLVAIDVVDGKWGDTFLGLDWAHWPVALWGLVVAGHTWLTFGSPARKRRTPTWTVTA